MQPCVSDAFVRSLFQVEARRVWRRNGSFSQNPVALYALRFCIVRVFDKPSPRPHRFLPLHERCERFGCISRLGFLARAQVAFTSHSSKAFHSSCIPSTDKFLCASPGSALFRWRIPVRPFLLPCDPHLPRGFSHVTLLLLLLLSSHAVLFRSVRRPCVSWRWWRCTLPSLCFVDLVLRVDANRLHSHPDRTRFNGKT